MKETIRGALNQAPKNTSSYRSCHPASKPIVEELATISNHDLSKSDVRIRELLDSISDSVFVLNYAAEVLYRNEAAAALFGHHRVRIGANTSELFSEGPIADLLTTQTEQEKTACFRFESHLGQPDKTFEIRTSPIAGGLALFIRDITEAKAVQHALQWSEKRLRQLVLGTSDMAWFTGGGDSVGTGAEAWMNFTGQTLPEMQQLGWLDATHPSEQARVKEAWLAAVREGKPYEIEHTVRRKDGIYRVMRARAFPVLDEAGEVREWVGTHTDITERDFTERELRQANERFVLATRASTDGIWDMDCVTGTVYYSARWRAIFGWPEQQAYGTIEDWFEQIHQSDYKRCRGIWEEVLKSTDATFQVELRCQHQDGSWRWILARAICGRGPDGTLARVTGSACDITAQKIIDPLTGLHNRASLLEQVQWRIDKAKDERRSFALLFLGLDSFKRINDSMGHRKGDAVLIGIARRLEDTVAGVPGSIVSRLGGDEFVILLGDVSGEEDALSYALGLEHLLMPPFDCSGHQVFVSASVGVAFGCAGVYSEAEQMLEDADVAMHRAKLNGKAQSALYSQAMREQAVARLQLEHELRIALQEEQFELVYQPKVWLPSGRVKGFEALIRWRHPERGMVSPVEFIPVAEDTGIILEIGRWVARTAIRQLAHWRREGRVEPAATMAINVSTIQFNEEDLLEFLAAELAAAELPPECITLEITESTMAEDSAAALRLLENVVAARMGLDLDDFGTGYSSLSYLHQFPFRSVKIDRTFIGRMTTDIKSFRLVESIVALARSLDMNLIAEGVETTEQAEHLLRLGCTVAQGYLFSPPRSAVEIEGFLACSVRELPFSPGSEHIRACRSPRLTCRKPIGLGASVMGRDISDELKDSADVSLCSDCARLLTLWAQSDLRLSYSAVPWKQFVEHRRTCEARLSV